MSREFWQKWESVRQTDEDGHAGESETSIMMALMPDSVKIDYIESSGHAMGRLSHLPGLTTPINWYANYPNHYAGDGHYGTKEKGEMLIEHLVNVLVDVIKTVKADTETERLYREFFSRIDH